MDGELEKIVEQAFRDGDEEREMDAYLNHLSSSGRLAAMIREARRRVDEEENSEPSDNVIPLRRPRKNSDSGVG